MLKEEYPTSSMEKTITAYPTANLSMPTSPCLGKKNWHSKNLKGVFVRIKYDIPNLQSNTPAWSQNRRPTEHYVYLRISNLEIRSLPQRVRLRYLHKGKV